MPAKWDIAAGTVVPRAVKLTSPPENPDKYLSAAKALNLPITLSLEVSFLVISVMYSKPSLKAIGCCELSIRLSSTSFL